MRYECRARSCFPGFSDRNNHPFSANPKVRHQSKGLHRRLAGSLECWTAVDLLSGICQLLLSHEYADPETGDQKAVFDLAWPNGIQEELSQPVAVLLNEPAETLSVASQAGYRFFTEVGDFKRYVKEEILVLEAAS